MSKWDTWYDSLPAHTKAYLKNQPLWYDIDMFKAFVVGIFVGTLIGLAI